METVSNIITAIVLLPFFLLDAIDQEEKNIKKDLNKMRTERAYQQKKSNKTLEGNKENHDN